MNELEVLGQKTVELANLNREYDSLLGLVARIKSGEVSPANVSVDLANRAWSIQPQNADLGLSRERLLREALRAEDRNGDAEGV